MRFIIILAIILFSANKYKLYSQEGTSYKNDNLKNVYLPLGKISFADSIVAFNIGKPLPYKKFRDSSQALHEPNYKSYNSPEYVSLGCKGSLTVAFTDNGFMNLPGNDLYIFEVGPSVEAARIEISENAIDWIFAGDITGGKSFLDLSIENIPNDKVYYFLRITDYKQVCKSKTAGADIDAIGAINSVIKLSIQADLLFDFDEYILLETAEKTIQNLTESIQQVAKATILIEGHTDSDGNEIYNLELSKKRGESVKVVLEKLLKDKGEYDFILKSYGERKPKKPNTTEENKQLNRRVEIIVLPPQEYYKSLQN
ncbi:MAG: OmpA family protein [Flavobacteriaceae bacterium]|nr:OmpA family protein [Flavobacteriaceae bacterium]